MRARRWTEKIFLSHWHYHAYLEMFSKEPPKPYIITHSEGRHVHEILPPD
jgi:hypothetical protein